MKKVIRQSMKEMLFKLLVEFSHEEHKDTSTCEHYAEEFTKNFERYLRAYHEFKE